MRTLWRWSPLFQFPELAVGQLRHLAVLDLPACHGGRQDDRSKDDQANPDAVVRDELGQGGGQCGKREFHVERSSLKGSMIAFLWGPRNPLTKGKKSETAIWQGCQGRWLARAARRGGRARPEITQLS